MASRQRLQQPRPLLQIPGDAPAIQGPSIWHPTGYPTKSSKKPINNSSLSSFASSFRSSTSLFDSQHAISTPATSHAASLGSPQGATFTPRSKLPQEPKKDNWWKRFVANFSAKQQKEKRSQPQSIQTPLIVADDEVVSSPVVDRPSQFGVKWQMNSQTPKEQRPTTWDEYHDAYSKQLIDVNDPPPPPDGTLNIRLRPDPDPEHTHEIVEATSLEEAAAQVSPQIFTVPDSYYERSRQIVVDRLDCFAKEAPKKRTYDDLPDPIPYPPNIHVTEEEYQKPVQVLDLIPTPPEGFTSSSLEGHPAFKKLVTYARQTFASAMSMLTIVDNDTVKFLAETGCGMEAVPRTINFCSHTVLASPNGFVIPDTMADWRFVQNPLTMEANARFYAGVPLYAPAYLNSDNEEIAIGTLCIIDDKPRHDFSAADRRKLQQLAELARKEVTAWHQMRLKEKTKGMQQQLAVFHRRAASAASSRTLPSVEEAVAEKRRRTSHPELFAVATRSIAITLNVPLVYLIAVNLAPNNNANPVASLDLISSFGLPNPPPVFDAVLHFKALRAPEGGLLYQNPDIEEMEDNERFALTESTTYASAILISVAEIGTRGYVLASFATSASRVFGIEDLEYLRKMATEMAPFCK